MKKLLITFIIHIFFIQAWGQNENEIKLANEYFMEGQFDKAEVLFEKLSKNKSNIPEIHSNYITLLFNKADYKTAEKYLIKIVDIFPATIQYHADLLYLYYLSENHAAKDKYFALLIASFSKNQYQLSAFAQNLVGKGMLEDARNCFLEARKISGNSRTYSLELASVYRLKNDKPSMTEEYLNYAMANPRNILYIQNIFQTLLNNEDDLDFLEETLIRNVQKDPDQLVYVDLLIWVELQRKNFYGAFIQAKAKDKRLGRPGDECMAIGKIALDNQAYENAIEIFTYVIDAYKNNYHYAKARQHLIESKEKYIKAIFPVDRVKIRELTLDYQHLYNEIGPGPVSFDALRNKAMLHAFYLDEKDEAIRILQDIIGTPRISTEFVNQCKIDLGDIYLLNDEPWEASLLYGQVQKENKYNSLGYSARLKNARLYYFTGNFALAESYLDILKQATTKEIANDAIDLGLLINNNTVFDTSDTILKQFAFIEMLNYQHQEIRAKKELIHLIEANPTHSLVDECYWLLATLALQEGKYTESISYLDQIIQLFPTDILGDDSFFLKAEITDKYLLLSGEAQALYRNFLDLYPGSMYAAEARKRFRILRGDRIN